MRNQAKMILKAIIVRYPVGSKILEEKFTSEDDHLVGYDEGPVLKIHMRGNGIKRMVVFGSKNICSYECVYEELI